MWAVGLQDGAPGGTGLLPPMRVSLSVAALVAPLLLGASGCDSLCEKGLGGDSCPPCKSTALPAAWNEPDLQPLAPVQDAVICKATAQPMRVEYWVPAKKVYATNVEVVTAAQESGWVRVEDNWSETEVPQNAPKVCTLRKPTGETLTFDVRTEGKGTRVRMAFEGPPQPPELRGDVTVFAYYGATYALFDGKVVEVPNVDGGVAVAQPDGFFFRHQNEYGRYEADGTTTTMPAFPTNAEGGFMSSHGAGPRGFPWVSYNPADNRMPLLLGELVEGNWDIEMVPDLQPALPYGTVDLAHSDDGKVWLLVGNVLYVRHDKHWYGTRLPANPGSIRPLAAEADAALISTEHAVLRARLEGERVRVSTVAQLDFYAELFDAGEAGVVARTKERVDLIAGDEVVPTELPGETKAPELATNDSGFIAVATRDPAGIMVRHPDGTMHRFPAEGQLDSTVFSLDIDPRGRVWTLLDQGDPLVADGDRLVPLRGFVGQGKRPHGIGFIGNGAPPLLDT